MEIGETIYFNSRNEFRKWLRKNHNKKKELWLLFYKKHLGKGILYTGAVEEALCYGWIDGILKSLGKEKHIVRFSPRRAKSVWSPHNIVRVKKMVKNKKMTKYGLRKIPKEIMQKISLEKIIK
ncbi:MAG: hypothetical protein AABW72_03740 [archaeon]